MRTCTFCVFVNKRHVLCCLGLFRTKISLYMYVLCAFVSTHILGHERAFRTKYCVHVSLVFDVVSTRYVLDRVLAFKTKYCVYMYVLCFCRYTCTLS